MFLKAIEIFGFKSFPDKTKIVFEDGITAIIGPNGCGKSNITDAIRWVLGEKSAKNLRGSHMEDVIFAGSDTVKPKSMAQVTMFIDNSDSILPGKFREIEIVRKLYRSGESEYFINKNKVLQKDIHNLFMDTGVGRNTYSFIGQGQVDMVLSKKFEDRKAIFEEAAGISKYKLKKTETLLKLEKTRENLLRLNDILIEIEKVRNSAKVQAEKAERFNKIKKELTEFEIKIHSYKYKLNLEKQKGVQKKLNEKIQKKEKTKETIATLNQNVHDARMKLSQTKDNKIVSEKEIITIENKIRMASEKKDILSAQIKRLELSIGEEKLLIESTTKKEKSVIENLNNISTKLKEKEEILLKTREELSEKEKELESNDKRIVEINKKLKESKERIVLLAHENESLRESLKTVIDELVKQIDMKKEEVLAQQPEKQALQKEIEETIQFAQDKIKKLSEQLEANSIDFDFFKKSFQELQSKLTHLTKQNAAFVALHDGFQEMIFDESGVHAQKENLENSIRKKSVESSGLQNNIALMEEEKNNLMKKREDLLEKLNATKHLITKLQLEKDNITHEQDNFKRQRAEYQEVINRYDKSIETKKKEIENTQKIIADFQKEFELNQKKIQDMNKKLKSFGSNIDVINKTIEKNELKLNQEKKESEAIDEQINNLKLSIREFEVLNNDLKELLFENYSVHIEETVKSVNDKFNLPTIQKRLRKLSEEKSNLGSINPMAIEEFRDSDERYKFLSAQKKDVEKAEGDLKEVLAKISEESEKLFLKTFNEIRKNYKELTRKLFRGGRADLILVDPDNPLNSPIDIIVQPPGKKNKNLDILSGGELTLTAISLIFSIFLTKPSPFSVLDEIDAPLDDHNNMRFLTVMKELSKNTQFFIITHNRQTMAAANRIYGVTMEEPATSKVVSLHLDNIDKSKYEIKDI